ncbi:MAG TPA: DUF481 domain-containing protein [Edaphobacter sp.]|jgi:hypothetical protein
MTAHWEVSSLFRRRGFRGLVCVATLTLLAALSLPLNGQEKPSATPDVVILKNGDQLTGKIERSVGTDLTFKSDALGEVTIPMDKVKELRSSSNFVVLKKDEKINREPKQAGTIALEDNSIKETTASGTQTVPEKNVGYIIDSTTYNKELNGNPGFFSGWDGAITGGATVLQSSSYGQTLTAGISLIRAIPSVAYLPPRTRTTFNLLETYGKLTQPVIPNPTHLPAAVAKTSIFHTDFEHDKYLTPRFYVLGGLSFDHNFAQGMQLQQIYGVGAGYTVLLDAIQQLDVKADLHYSQLKYIAPIQPLPPEPPIASTPDLNLIGSTFGEAYKRTLPGKILLTQSASFIQSWNNTDAWSAIGALGLALPVYHRFSLSASLLDNYLNLPAPGFNKNSLQFVTGVTYTLH